MMTSRGWRFFAVATTYLMWSLEGSWNSFLVDALVAPSMTNNGSKRKDDGTVYRYFCYGSNVLPSTMENLRGIRPLEATAAMLPGYQLRFLGGGGRLEPSAAFAVPTTMTPPSSSDDNNNDNNDDCIHGVMYTLSAEDFARVGSTEGVPFAYRWKRCKVYPYVGKEEGQDGTVDLESKNELMGQDAVTLIPPESSISREDVPPSSSYLTIIKEGAAYWKLDASYQAKLERIPTAQNLVVPGGLSGPLLRMAELSARFRRQQG
jgi:hypothetical protein